MSGCTEVEGAVLSILHWRCAEDDVGRVGNHVAIGLSILHWRCPSRRSGRLGYPSRSGFQYSIGDAHELNSYGVRHALQLNFQYSIGDACLRGRRMGGWPCLLAFNTPLEMPGRDQIADLCRYIVRALSILHWRCLERLLDVELRLTFAYLSILHWRCATVMSARSSRAS